MLVDALLQHEMEGQVNRMVEKVRGQEGSQGSSRGNEANRGGGKVPDFATIIAQQLRNLLPTIVAQVGNHVNNEGNNKNQGDNVTKGVHTRGREAVVGMTWEDFKTFTREDLCPNNEMQKIETQFWCHVMVEASHVAYTDRFHKLARLVPYLVTLENKRIERYIYGLAPSIRAMVATIEPTIIQSVVLKAGGPGEPPCSHHKSSSTCLIAIVPMTLSSLANHCLIWTVFSRS
nr:reverse transcriptase domain-containing protein [Tanacetum cinerariifolium]